MILREKYLAQKGQYRYLVQVAFSVSEKKTYDRELGAFVGCSDLDRRILITNDELDYSTSTIRHISLPRFLELESLA